MLSLEEQIEVAVQIKSTRSQILSNLSDLTVGTSFLWRLFWWRVISDQSALKGLDKDTHCVDLSAIRTNGFLFLLKADISLISNLSNNPC